MSDRPNRAEVVTAAVVIVSAALALSAQRAAQGVGDARPDAVAWHGAWQMYSKLAHYFGRKALRAEQLYWEAVQS